MRLAIVIAVLCLAVQAFGAVQPRVNGVEVMQANDGRATNLTSIGTIYSGPDALNWWGTINGAFLLGRRTNGQASFRMIADRHSNSTTNTFFSMDLDPGDLGEMEFRSIEGASDGNFVVQVNPGESALYLDINGSRYTGLHPSVADAEDAIAYKFATLNTLANAGARLLSVQNPLGTEKFGITPSGAAVSSGTLTFQKAGTAVTRVAGTFSVSTTPVFNAGTSSTNIFTNFIPGLLLTNDGDTVEWEVSGMFANLLTPTNNYTVSYGNDILLSAINWPASNTTWQISGTITRLGNTSQFCRTRMELGGIPNGAGYGFTNRVMISSQTNGIDTRLQITWLATVNGGITNRVSRLKYFPAP